MSLIHFSSGRYPNLINEGFASYTSRRIATEYLSSDQNPTWNWYYDIIFVYNSTMEFRIVENIEFNFDFENDKKEILVETNQSDRLDPNFQEVDIIAMLIYDKTGQIHERKIYEVRLNKMNQKYSVSDENQKVELKFGILSETIHLNDTTPEQSLESWIKERRRERKIDDLMK